VVLAVGTELSEVDYYYQDDIPRFDGPLIRVDTDPSQVLTGRDPAVAIVGDARGVLTGLADRLNRGGDAADRGEAAARRVRELRAGLKWWPGAAELFPVLDAIAGAVPADAIITADSTQLAYVANCYLSVTNPRSYLSPSGFGTLGPALPMRSGRNSPPRSDRRCASSATEACSSRWPSWRPPRIWRHRSSCWSGTTTVTARSATRWTARPYPTSGPTEARRTM
jgi:hypothetical protein